MELLKQRILKDGKAKVNNILKVDSFLNHQIDIKLMNEIGKEFSRRFREVKVDKILTIEASGIAIASITAQYFNYVPVVFAKKAASMNIDKDVYESQVHSFTKNKSYNVIVGKDFIKQGENVLILDDFLANGCAAKGLIDIVRSAGANVIGLGIVIEKGFQEGRSKIEESGVKVEALAIIEKMEEDKIYFR